MSFTHSTLIARAIMSDDPQVRQDAEDLSGLLSACMREFRDVRTSVLIEADGARPFLADGAWFDGPTWDRCKSVPEIVTALRAQPGHRITDGRDFTAAGTRRKAKVAK